MNRLPLKRLFTSCVVAGSLAVTGCGEGVNEDVPRDEPGFPGIFDSVPQRLDAIACDLTGNLASFTMADGETAIVSLRSADKALLVNGVPCVTAAGVVANTTNTKRLNVTGSAGANTVILDYLQGSFLPGSSTAIGVDLALGAGADSIRIRGSRVADTVTVGADGISTGTDGNRDINFSNSGTLSIVASLGEGNDVFTGAGGRGTGLAYAAALTVYGGAGNDTLTGGDGGDTINGGTGNDLISGGLGIDTLNGDEDDDTFDEGTANSGADVFNGGSGIDTVTYARRTVGVTVTMGAGADDGETGATEGDDVTASIEILVGTALADVLTGSAGNDTINAGAGDDQLSGGGGDDILRGEAGYDTFLEGTAANGADVFHGGPGIDTVSYALRTAGVTVSINGVADDGTTGANENDNVMGDVENLVGSAFGDVLTGSALANVIDGGLGDDTLNGLAGDDTFPQGAAPSGSDTIIGGDGVDTVDYSLRTVALVITMDDGLANDGEGTENDNIGATVENLVCGAHDCTVTGNALDNVIYGSTSADRGDGNPAVNVLSGLGGDDQLFGGPGDDTLNGGAGDDLLDGAAGTNTLDCGLGQGDIGISAGGTMTGCEL